MKLVKFSDAVAKEIESHGMDLEVFIKSAIRIYYYLYITARANGWNHVYVGTCDEIKREVVLPESVLPEHTGE